MLFNSLVFLFAFLPVTYLVFWKLSTSQGRYLWLAVTGYVFYGYWDPRFCLLMAFSTMVSFSAGLGFLYARSDRVRWWLLVLPITIDLLLLGFFKYANFTIESFGILSQWIGHPIDVPVLNIVLPIGISFYTFHTITYIVDCYRGTIRPTKNPFEFAAYVSLFSQLVAGPIVRYREIEQDLDAIGTADRTRWLAKGIAFFLIGMIEKVLIADTLAAWVDPAWREIGELSSSATWLAVFGYTFQLYFDFCGYSNMAVGLGYMFGIQIPQNFNSPYKALDPSDFWQRWHISLSSCLRDYLYIPLGGNRGGAWKTNRNLLLTMLIGGLWHGANWTFVFWGLYHGILLIAHRASARKWEKLPGPLRRIVMFLLVSVGWVFFRSTSMSESIEVLRRMLIFTSGNELPNQTLIFLTLLMAGYLGLFAPNAFDLLKRYEWRSWHSYAFASILGISVALIVGGGNSPFLYFQF